MKASQVFSAAITTLVFVAGLGSLTSTAVAMEMATPGAFRARQCGLQSSEINAQAAVSVKEICIGSIPVGDFMKASNTDAVEFRMASGENKVFHVASSSNMMVALPSGNVKAVLYLNNELGEQVAMKVIKTQDGRVVAAAGELANVNYFVPQFKSVVTFESF